MYVRSRVSVRLPTLRLITQCSEGGEIAFQRSLGAYLNAIFAVPAISFSTRSVVWQSTTSQVIPPHCLGSVYLRHSSVHSAIYTQIMSQPLIMSQTLCTKCIRNNSQDKKWIFTNNCNIASIYNILHLLTYY